MDAVWAPVAVIVAAIISALGAWFLAKRKSSGTVKTSEASELWQASSEIRTMLINEARARTAENEALRKEAADCHKIQAELERRVAYLERQVTNGGSTQG